MIPMSEFISEVSTLIQHIEALRKIQDALFVEIAEGDNDFSEATRSELKSAEKYLANAEAAIVDQLIDLVHDHEDHGED